MEYRFWRSEKVRRRGQDRREAEERARDAFIAKVMVHVKEGPFRRGSWVHKTTTRRRDALIYLTAIRNGETAKPLAERFGCTPRQAAQGLIAGPALVLEVIRSGKLGVIEGWGLQVVADCERRLAKLARDVPPPQRHV
jgi:hypothetical protein